MDKPFKYPRDIFLIATHAIQGLGDHEFEASTTRGLHERWNFWSILEGAAADRVVVIDFDDIVTLVCRILPAKANLTLDRGG